MYTWNNRISEKFVNMDKNYRDKLKNCYERDRSYSRDSSWGYYNNREGKP